MYMSRPTNVRKNGKKCTVDHLIVLRSKWIYIHHCPIAPLYSRPEDIADKMMRVECLIVNVPQLSADTLFQYLQDSYFSSRLQNNLQLGPLQLSIASKPGISCGLIL